jgi:hypothetical protein
VSTWAKSTARIVRAWVARNCFQVGPERRGDGSTPAVLRIFQTVAAATKVAESGKFALDPSVSPRRILPGQLEHQVTDGRMYGWPPGLTLWVGPVAFDQLGVPAQQGLGCHGPM